MDQQNVAAECDPPRVPRRSQQNACADQPDSEASRRRAAIFSVYHHAYARGGADRLLLPPALRPMRIEQAVRIKPREDQPFMLPLLMAKLIASAGAIKNDAQQVVPGNRHGLGPATQFLFERTHDRVAAISWNDLIKQLTNTLSPLTDKTDLLLDSRAYSVAVHNLFLSSGSGPNLALKSLSTPGPLSKCTCTKLDEDLDFDINTLVSKASVKVQAERDDPDELAKVMDPVSWAVLGPDYFGASYKVKTDSMGKVSYGSDGLPEKDDKHVPGTSWKGLLYEDFRWNWNEMTLCEFRNLLNIDFTVDTTTKEITMIYKLSESIDSTVGLDYQSGGIDVDSGEVHAPYDSGANKFIVTASKNVRFTNRMPGGIAAGALYDLGMGLNYMAPVLVEMFLDSAVSTGVCQILGS